MVIYSAIKGFVQYIYLKLQCYKINAPDPQLVTLPWSKACYICYRNRCLNPFEGFYDRKDPNVVLQEIKIKEIKICTS